MRRRPRPRSSALIVCAVLTACGPARNDEARLPALRDSATVGATTVHVGAGCSYLTAAQASAALGQASRFRPRQPTPAACTIEPASGDVFHGITLDYRVTQGTAQFDFLAAQKDAQRIGGLGDRAVWLPAGKARGNLAVVRGSAVVTLTVTDLSGNRGLEQKARDVARLVIEHW